MIANGLKNKKALANFLRNDTFQVTSLNLFRSLLQAALYFLIPLKLSTNSSYELLLIITFLNTFCHIVPLGSQFLVLKQIIIQHRVPIFNFIFLACVIIVCFTATLFFKIIYSNLSESFFLIMVLLLTYSTRVVADAFLQSIHLFKFSQILYVIISILRILYVLLIGYTFISWAILEIILFSPWIYILLARREHAKFLWGYTRRVNKERWQMFISSSTRSILQDIDKYIIALISNGSMFIYYFLFSRCLTVGQMLTTGFFSHSIPKIISARTINELNYIHRHLKKMIYLGIIAITIAIGLTAVIYHINFSLSISMLILFLVYFYFNIDSSFYLDYLFYHNKINHRIILQVFAILIYSLGIYIGIPYIGIYAPIASLCLVNFLLLFSAKAHTRGV